MREHLQQRHIDFPSRWKSSKKKCIPFSTPKMGSAIAHQVKHLYFLPFVGWLCPDNFKNVREKQNCHLGVVIQYVRNEEEMSILPARCMHSAAEHSQTQFVLRMPLVPCFLLGHRVADVLLKIKMKIGFRISKVLEHLVRRCRLTICSGTMPPVGVKKITMTTELVQGTCLSFMQGKPVSSRHVCTDWISAGTIAALVYEIPSSENHFIQCPGCLQSSKFLVGIQLVEVLRKNFTNFFPSARGSRCLLSMRQ